MADYSAVVMILGAILLLGMAILTFFVMSHAHRKGAKLLPFFPRLLLLNRFHRGFLMDGKRARLSHKHSYQSVLITGGVGKGKSSVFAIPNLLTLKDCSVVVTDTSGELFAKTALQMERRGFKVCTLDLMDFGRSFGYNPLANLHSYTEVHQAAHLIIRSALPEGQDAFWSAGAEKILRVIIKCLINQGREDLNLSSVKKHLANFDVHLPGKSQFDQFVLKNTVDDEATYADYRGFTNGNDRTMLSFISTADTALSALANPELAELTSRNEITFTDMRKQKTVLYLKVRQQDLGFYSFLLSLFYTDLCNQLLRKLDDEALPCFMLLDEFGHMTLPSFDVFATTARKYRVGFMLFLQSLAQLESRYGRKAAETIVDAVQTEVYFGGMSVDTAKALERRIGKVKVPKGSLSGQTLYQEQNLFSEDELIRLQSNQVLLMHSNFNPVLVKVKPYFR